MQQRQPCILKSVTVLYWAIAAHGTHRAAPAAGTSFGYRETSRRMNCCKVLQFINGTTTMRFTSEHPSSAWRSTRAAPAKLQCNAARQTALEQHQSNIIKRPKQGQRAPRERSPALVALHQHHPSQQHHQNASSASPFKTLPSMPRDLRRIT